MLIFISIIEKEPTELVLQKAYISSHIDRTAVKTNLNSDDRKKIRLFFLFQVVQGIRSCHNINDITTTKHTTIFYTTTPTAAISAVTVSAIISLTAATNILTAQKYEATTTPTLPLLSINKNVSN